MEELHRDEWVVVTADGDRVTMRWQREEPNDEHAVGTAKIVQKALDAFLAAHVGEKFRVLVDLTVVKRTFPRTIASFTGWLLGHRDVLKAGAFATKSLLLRAALSTAVVMPGITVKGFSSVDDARAFLDTKG